MNPSLLGARVDLYCALRGGGNSAGFESIDTTKNLAAVSFSTDAIAPPARLTWVRNQPGEADQLDVDLFYDAFPIDPRTLRGIAIDAWLFEHQTPSTCRKGDPGHFSGVVDRVEVKGSKLTLNCRDWTMLPMNTKIGEGVLGKVPTREGAPLGLVVRQLLNIMPGGEKWTIEALSPIGDVRAEPPKIRPAEKRKGAASASNAAVVKGPNLGQYLPPGDTSVWAAVQEVCVRSGYVAEVSERDSGRLVTLVRSIDLQLSTVLRPFEQGSMRRIVEEEIGADAITESYELTTSQALPDFVEVASIDPTGRLQRVVARWPRDAGKTKGTTNGVFQTIEGVTSLIEVERIARDAWDALAHNQSTIEIAMPHPWSSGGGPERPDLLDIGYGAGIILERLPRPPINETLLNAGIDARTARRFQNANDQVGEFRLLYQVVEAQHTWPEYECKLTMRQYGGLSHFDFDDIGTRQA
jgi:hypothetical protein